MANKTFNTRIKNKRDTAANWEKVATTFQPLDGELIVVDTAAGKTRFKVGRYDSSKDRLLYYNEIPFTDEYLYNDLNESQGKIYDALNGLDERTFIESTLEPSDGNGTTVCVYNIGLWQFPKSGHYKLKLSKLGTINTLVKLFARKTQDDGTTPEDFNSTNIISMANMGSGDGKSEYLFVLADYLDDDKQTAYKIQFLNFFGFANAVYANTYDKTTQKWAQTIASQTKLSYLTIKKGDTNTYYDGRATKTVEIPTKVSELTNDSFVSYAEQTLTDEQKTQAKTNLGINALVGNTTDITPAQVKEAILAGRPVVITYTDSTWGNLEFTSFGYSVEQNAVVANLAATNNNNYILAYLIGTSSGWSLQTEQLTTANELNTAIDNVSNEYVKYASAQNLTDDQQSQARTNIGAISEAELVQPDWEQNDETAKDYIKNRICYEEETVTELGNTVEVWVSLVGEEASTSVLKLLDIPISYKIKGVLYENQKPSKMENYVMYYGERYGENPEYVMISTYSPHNMSFNGMEASDFQFVKIENTVKQIDSKFIHTLDTIAEQAGDTTPVNSNAVMSVINMLMENVLLTCFISVFDQGFDENQKQVARNNIGALGADDIDTTLSSTSENAVQNKAVKAAIEEVQASIDSITAITNDKIDEICGASVNSVNGVKF